MQVAATGIAWYRREEYQRLKEMFKDGSELPDTFDDWQITAQGLHDNLTVKGCVVEKAYIDPKSFPEWCRANGREMDSHARMVYANEFAANKHRTQERNSLPTK